MANYYYMQNNGGICPSGVPLWQPRAQQTSSSSEQDVLVKVLSSVNKKDYKVYTLRGVRSDEVNSPEKLKEIILNQCGTDIVPPVEKMEIGYYSHSKKIWINNRLDLNDAWKIERVTFWCHGASEASRKRDSKSGSEDEQDAPGKSSRKMSRMEEKRATVEEYERQLKEKHGNDYTGFQYKLWAEMVAVGSHNDLDEPPTASMFNKTRSKPVHGENSINNTVISGMMSVMNSLCQSVTSQQVQKSPVVISPVKKAELRSTYMRQLAELRKLFDGEIINEEEYEEQRRELVLSMRHLNSQ